MDNEKHGVRMGVVVLILLVAAYTFGYNMGHKGYVFQPSSFKVVNQNTLPQTVDYSLLTDAINKLNTYSINKPLDQQKILYGAISGAVASLGDPYTTFFDPKSLNNFQTNLKGSFDGIGAEVGADTKGNVVIIAPLPDSPAAKAGLMPKDIIAAVNATSTSGMSVDQVVNLIRGPKGTQVMLSLIRGTNSKPFEVKITRDQIVVKSVTWKYVNNVAVVTVSEFGDDTTALFTQAVNDILTHHVNGVIIDLRNNPGGYLQSAVDVASNWLSLGTTVVTEAHSDGTNNVYKAEGNNRLKGIKTVVLMNGGTASAAEILSGALHDYNVAELVGEKSFGKGSVQELFNLNDGSAIKITIAKWITPKGVNLNHNGLDPDVAATLTQDDVNAGKDPQMDKAMQEVTK